jgi:hypothetical protein
MELMTIIHRQKMDYLPIIYAFSSQITKHIIIYDDAEEESMIAKEVVSSLKAFHTSYDLSTEIELVEIDEDSKQEIQKVIKQFEGNQKLVLNGTGADSALLIVLSSLVLRNKGRVFSYDKVDNTYNIITEDGFTNHKIEKNMTLEVCLLLMGESIQGEINQDKMMKNAPEILSVFSDIPQMFKIRHLLKTKRSNELLQKYPRLLESLKRLSILDNQYHLQGNEAFVRFGELFEAFIYLKLREYFVFDDIKVGVRICFDKKGSSQERIEIVNEFDILLIHQNKIGFIECKLGDSHTPLETVYKSDSILEYFGEDASSLIVNLERNRTPHLKNSKKNFGDTILFRAKTKKISVYNAFQFNRKDFIEKVVEAFGSGVLAS